MNNDLSSLSFSQGKRALGKGWSMEVPDGFVIKPGLEGRDFIAYLPNDNAPGDHQMSSFIIYAVQKDEDDAFDQLKTVCEYSSFAEVIHAEFNITEEDSRSVVYDRRDLPGALVYSYDEGCLHAFAYVGIEDYLQIMRFQIEITHRNRDIVENLIKEIMDHMHADKPAEMLEELDADEFVKMDLQSNTSDRWIQCVNEYVRHIVVGGKIRQTVMDNDIEMKRSLGILDITQMKSNITSLMTIISKFAEKELRKAVYIYTLKCVRYPGNSKLNQMKEAVLSLIDLTRMASRINGEEFSVRSDYAEWISEKLSYPITEVRDDRQNTVNFQENQKNRNNNEFSTQTRASKETNGPRQNPYAQKSNDTAKIKEVNKKAVF